MVSSVLGNTPIQSVKVTLRGTTYDIDNVTTVAELQERVQEQTKDTSTKLKVLFDGKKLSSSDILANVGVTEGSQLNMVPASKKSSNTKKKSSTVATPPAASTTTSSSESTNPMKEMLEKSGIDASKIDELVESMGGGAGAGDKMPSMQESMEMMGDMMNSPIFQEYMNDPDRLEESRQMILNNPMLKSMMAGMPGMEELLNDKDAWKEAMQAAADMYKNMDPQQMMAMMGGAGGAPGAGGAGGLGDMAGLFEGMDVSTKDLGLDELSEDED